MTEGSTPPRLCFDPATKQIGLRVGKVELGQHIHDAYRTMVAKVLGVQTDRISVLPVSTATSPDDGLTVGSLSVQVTGAQIEGAARETFEALRAAAAQRLNTKAISFDPAAMAFRTPSAMCSLWDLVQPEDLADIAPPTSADPTLGQKCFIQDLTWPGMGHARALRGRRVADVQPLLTPEELLIEDGDFAAVLTRDEARLAALWAKLPKVPSPGDTRFDGPVQAWMPDARTVDQGDAPVAADFTHEIATSRPFILHGSIAPSCGIAHWSGTALTVWSHSQGIFPLRAQIARVLGLEATQVEVLHVPSAGCYGHNGADDAALDAAMVAMGAKGRHIRVTWPREDDMGVAPVGAPMLVHAKARVDTTGQITAWHQEILSAPHGQRPGGGGHVNLLAAMERDTTLRPADIADLPAAVGLGAARNAAPIYDIPDVSARTRIVQDLPVRTSSLRGLGAQMNTIAIEALIDQIAGDHGEDPFAFRRHHLTDPRAIAALDALQARCPLAKGPDQALGIAIGRYKNKAAYGAVAVLMSLEDEPTPLKITAVVDAGRVVCADGARNQIEGGILQAASWTLCEGAFLRDGRIDARSWSDYPLLDWDRIPDLDIHLMDQPDAPPLGVGECMVGPASAAIVNAASACVGQPVTHLPLNRAGLIAALA